MNYGSLKSKLELIRSEGESNLSSISTLSSYYHLIHEHLTTQYLSLEEKIKAHLSPIEDIREDSPHLSSNVSALFSSLKLMTTKALKQLNQLSQDIISPLEEFHKSQSQIYADTANDFQGLMDHLQKAQRSLDNSKFIYYNSSFISKHEGNEKSQRMRLAQANNETLYSYEYSNYTKVIEECNSRNDKLIDGLKKNEESRIYFIKYIMDKYTKLIEEYQSNISTMLTTINELFATKKCEDELQSIIKKLKVDKTSDNAIIREPYVQFDEYIKATQEESNSPFNFEIIASSESIDDLKVNETLFKAKEQLLSKDNIEANLVSLLMKYFRSNPTRTGHLLLDSFNDNEWYQCLNYSNFTIILTLILFIDNNINEEKQDEQKSKDITDAQYSLLLERHSLNQKIITASQKIYYEKEDKCPFKTKIYLSAVLSKKDQMYSSKSFWKDLFNMIILNQLNDHLLLSSKQPPREDNEESTQMSHISHMSRAKTLISYASSSVSSSLSRIWISSDIRTKGVLYRTKISCFIPNYSKMSLSDINAIEDKAVELIKKNSIFKDFITQMTNFNYPIEKIIELLTEIGEEAKLSKDTVNYLISISNVNWYTIKRLFPRDKDYQSDYYLNNYRLTSKEKRVKLIAFGLDYLQWRDYYALLQLSKASYKKLSNKIFKKALQRSSLPMETRLKIWHSILKVNSLTKHYSYAELLQKASMQLDDKTSKAIEVDLPRTYISPSLDRDKAMTAIRNILLAISQVNGEGKYCQGMNFIAQFLYEITRDEEKAFNVFLGIFKSTEYSLIFGQNLLKFKLFFYVFKRLIIVNEPEISAVLKRSKCNVYYFLAPCFYPLFQNVREFIQEEGVPLILLRVFDGFITSGWKGLMKVALNVLINTSSQIMTMQKDELYEFITTKIFAIDFFHQQNITLYELFQQKKIPKKLIEYIEQEYIQRIALKEIDKAKAKAKEKEKDKESK